ncbi:MAG: cysteine-rich CWC family protein [Rhodocyclaceae bacterium]|nr:cysteine-rich CWC family protein [Rhodocyclaceae bacterium]
MSANDCESRSCGGNSVCPGCGGQFDCGMLAGEACWCAVLPRPTFPLDPGKGCYCPACLKRKLVGQALSGAAVPEQA